MNKIYLFDWGNTLMVDFADQEGKMCEWDKIQAVNGAHEALNRLSKKHEIYIATNAGDSSVLDIEQAFQRVGLAKYATGYFCKANLGFGKGDAEFFNEIACRLKRQVSDFVMVGDSLNKDIYPALMAGMDAIWLNTLSIKINDDAVNQIVSLHQL